MDFAGVVVYWKLGLVADGYWLLADNIELVALGPSLLADNTCLLAITNLQVSAKKP
ncbi:hypothetical protein [Bacillus sp. UNC41MFS5]|uniref:hypothetical protein n=1 Tax=Bacillus sp. UNC41MFS5 TaxID=1449046 RepID=UPI000A4B34A0|nr:hypothetical protein [Bacillus sp. UNC41MFS5]